MDLEAVESVAPSLTSSIPLHDSEGLRHGQVCQEVAGDTIANGAEHCDGQRIVPESHRYVSLAGLSAIYVTRATH